MEKYVGIASIILFILTFLVIQFFVLGKVSDATGSAILMIGVGISIVTAKKTIEIDRVKVA